MDKNKPGVWSPPAKKVPSQTEIQKKFDSKIKALEKIRVKDLCRMNADSIKPLK
jgi:hypothetical protein